MGFLDIFKRKPAWQKNCEEALEAIGSSADPELILRVVKETAFAEKEEEIIALRAADRLWELRNGCSGAKESLEQLAREAASPIARCHAACYLRSREKMKKLIADNVVAAYRRLDGDVRKHPKDAAEWIECVEDKMLLVAAFENACKSGSFRNALYPHIHGDHVLTTLFMAAKDETVQQELVERVAGSAEEYEQIAGQSTSPRCATAAIDHLKADSPVLRKLAEEGHNGAFRRLKQLGREDVVKELADGGNLVALKYLASTHKSTYEKKYEEMMREDLRKRAMAADKDSFKGANLIGEAVRKRVLPEEKLVEIALTWHLNDMSSLPWEAMSQVTDPGRLTRLLMERKPEARFTNSRSVWNAWGKSLVDRLADREDVLMRCILESSYDGDVKRNALGHIQDPEKLLKIAMSDHWLAPEAAKLLPKNRLASLRDSKSSQAAKLGQAQYNRNRVSKASEAELMEILSWELENSSDTDVYLHALERVESQSVLLDALRGWLSSGKRHGITDENKPWKSVGGAILERITDGAGLVTVCLEKPGAVGPEFIARMKALIGGTPEEANFTEAARQKLFTNPNNYPHYAGLLSMYYDMADSMHALWRFGGPEFVRFVLDNLNNAKEYESAKGLGAILARLYKSVPESHPSLDSVKGKRYSKHVDIVSNCASENENHDREYMLEL